MQQIQFGRPVKKTENRKNRIHVKENRILPNLSRTLEEILKVRVQKFRGYRGSLPEVNHNEKCHWKMLLQKKYRDSSPTAPILSLSVAIFND